MSVHKRKLRLTEEGNYLLKMDIQAYGFYSVRSFLINYTQFQ